MGGGADRSANLLLARLSLHDAGLILPDLTPAHLDRGTVLYYPGDPIEKVYFPSGISLASLVLSLEDGREVDTLMVGHEGVIGGILGHRLPIPCRVAVKLSGTFLVLDREKLEAAKERSRAFRETFARYEECLLAQVLQSIACNAAHSIEQRTAKWIAAAAARTGTMSIPFTHEQLSAILGVGRSYASRVIETLAAQNILDTKRGSLTIRDVARLRAKACACNDAVEKQCREILSLPQ